MVYPGGKNGAGVFQRIISLMPPHDRYVEAFCGSGAVMRMKRPAAENIAYDLDPAALEQCQELVRDGDTAGLTVDQVDFRNHSCVYDLDKFDRRTLIYCDPPYVHSTRSDLDLYAFELTDDDHADLLKRLRRSLSMVMVSGYRCDLYDEKLSDWSSIDYATQTRGGVKTETLWFNFLTPDALHDYSYLGEGYRERERIKRKKQRWINKLRNMERLERQAILAAIAETVDAAAPAPPTDTFDESAPGRRSR